MGKIYKDSKVEVSGFEAKYYNILLNIITFGMYNPFIKKVIKSMDIHENDKILDLGCGSGENAIIMSKYLTNGFILGLDITDDMIKQFLKKTKKFKNIHFLRQRIDMPFAIFQNKGRDFTPQQSQNRILFDKAFISFVLHGLPQENRIEVLKNAYNNLTNKGIFFVLDYNQIPLDKTPKLYQFFFKKIECKYAFDFIERDLSKDIETVGFKNLEKQNFFKDTITLYRIYK